MGGRRGNEVKNEMALKAFEQRMSDQLAAFHRINLIRVDARWGEEFYRDGIHPNENGNRILADIIGDSISVSHTVIDVVSTHSGKN